MRKTNFVGVFDFETITPDWNNILTRKDIPRAQQVRNYYKKNPVGGVYAWALCFDSSYTIIEPRTQDYGKRISKDGTEIYYYGCSVESFLEFCASQTRDWKIYAHNLKGFDGRYILPALRNIGFTQAPDPDRKVSQLPDLGRQDKINAFYGTKKDGTEYDWRLPLPYEFRVSIEKNKAIYWIKLYVPNTDGKSSQKLRTISFEDNLLMFNTSIKEMGKQLANHFIKLGVPEDEANEKYNKQSINYIQDYYFNSIEELEQARNGELLEYLLRDVYVLHMFRRMMSEDLAPSGFPMERWKRTQGSTAVFSWTEELGNKLFEENKDYIEVKHQKKGGKMFRLSTTWKSEQALKDDLIKAILPTDWLLQGSTFRDVYEWYRGGITKANEDYRGAIVQDVNVIDIVSSYPTIMYSSAPCPWGAPVPESEGTWHLYKIDILKPIHNKEGLPFVQRQAETDEGITSEHVAHLWPGETIKLTTPEYERFKAYYKPNKGDIHITAEYSFKTKPFSYFFAEYINKWYHLKAEAKAEGNIFKKNFSKVMLNSLYGKFGTKRLHESYKWDESTESYISQIEESDMIMYLPIAIAITANARMKLVDGVGNDYKGFIYCDTDSLFIKTWLFDKIIKEGRVVIGEELGNWELENKHPYRMIARRAKQYLAFCQVNGLECPKCKGKAQKIAYAGINFLVNDETYIKLHEGEEMSAIQKQYRGHLTFKDFVYGKKIDSQLSPILFQDWGVVLFENEKAINPIWEYPPFREQWVRTEEDFIRRYNETKEAPL